MTFSGTLDPLCSTSSLSGQKTSLHGHAVSMPSLQVLMVCCDFFHVATIGFIAELFYTFSHFLTGFKQVPANDAAQFILKTCPLVM